MRIETSPSLCRKENFFVVTCTFVTIDKDNKFKNVLLYADANPPRLRDIYVVDQPKAISSQMELRFRARRENLTLFEVLAAALREEGGEIGEPIQSEYVEEIVIEKEDPTEKKQIPPQSSTSEKLNGSLTAFPTMKFREDSVSTGSRTLDIVSNAVDSVRDMAHSFRKNQELKSERLQNEVLQQRLEILKTLSSEKEALEEMKLKLEIERTKLEIQKMQMENERLKRELGQS